jgi:hypothetical protein
MTLAVLDDLFSICRLGPAAPIPDWAHAGALVSITRTGDELSIVCPQSLVPQGIRAEQDFRALKIEGPLDFSLTGLLANLSGALAAANISLFALSTFDTDYILVRDRDALRAVQALEGAGHQIQRATSSE